MATQLAKSKTLIKTYLGQKLEAQLDGSLFDHVPGTFSVRFVDPRQLRETLQQDFCDEVSGWDFDNLIPIAAVSSVDATDYEFAWLFLDWRARSTPRVVVATTDDWGGDRSAPSLEALKLKPTAVPPPPGKGPTEFQFAPGTKIYPSTTGQVFLSGRAIKTLAPEIGLFTRCKELQLDKNELSRLPVEIGQMKGLQKLDVSDNPLTELPAELARCVKLEKLQVSGTKLDSLPPLPNLKILMASRMTPDFVRSLCDVPSLEAIHIDSCGLTALPPEIAKLTHLRFLNLTSNKLKKLPDELATMKSLTQMFVFTGDNPLAPGERKRLQAKMPWCT